MKYKVGYSSQFKKDLKLAQRRGCDIALLFDVVRKIACGETLDARFRDHELSGKYAGCRECHIKPDWLLVYRIDAGKLLLVLSRTGTHSDLF